MAQILQTFYKNVQEICLKDNEQEFIRYLTTRGISLLKQLLELDLKKWYSPVQGRDFGHFLLKIIPLCYPHISVQDAEKAHHNLPPISTTLDFYSTEKCDEKYFPFYQDNDNNETSLNLVTGSVLNVVECIFYLIIKMYSEPTVDSSDSSTHVEIIQILSTVLANETWSENVQISPVLLWFYQMRIRALLSVIRKTFKLFPSVFISQVKPLPISIIINDLSKRLISSSLAMSHSSVHLTFDILQGFLILIDDILSHIFDKKMKKMSKKETKYSCVREMLSLISELITSDYFLLFDSVQKQCETRSKQILEYLHQILKRLKWCRMYVYDKQRCKNRNIKLKTDKQCKYIHLHQSQFEIIITIATNNGTTTTKRICIISALYDKLLRLIVKQFKQKQPSIAYIQDCLNILLSCGSCSCYSLSHYRSLLSNVNHFIDYSCLQRQTISLLRNAFLLIRTCNVSSSLSLSMSFQTNKQSFENIYTNNTFWTYVSSHLLQQDSSTQFSLEFSHWLYDLVQCCSETEKQTILFVCVLPTLDHYRLVYSTTHANENTEIIVQNILLTLPTLIDCISDVLDPLHILQSSSNSISNVPSPISNSPSSINSVSPSSNCSSLPPSINIKQSTISTNSSLLDILISLSTLNASSSLLSYTLPVIGYILNLTSSTIEYLGPLIDLVLRCTLRLCCNDLSSQEQNIFQIILILLIKCPSFRHAYFDHVCYTKVHEYFLRIIQGEHSLDHTFSTLLALVLVSSSYSQQPDFTYEMIIDYLYKIRQQHDIRLWIWLEFLLRLTLSQRYTYIQTWKTPRTTKIFTQFEQKQDDSNGSDGDDDVEEDEETDEIYNGDIDSLSDEQSKIAGRQKKYIYSNLIVFPELLMICLKLAWENMEYEWNEIDERQQRNGNISKAENYSPLVLQLSRLSSSTTMLSSVTILINYLEKLSYLTKTTKYNQILLKKLHFDEYLFHILLTVGRRHTFQSKDLLIQLIITILQNIWSNSINVNQLEQCFKLFLTHRSLIQPILKLFKYLITYADPNQPRAYSPQPLTSGIGIASGSAFCLTVNTLTALLTEPHQSTNVVLNSRESAMITEPLKSTQIQFPLTLSLWLKVNFPFIQQFNQQQQKHNGHENQHDQFDNSLKQPTSQNQNIDGVTEKNNDQLLLHVLTLHNEQYQFQFWLDSIPSIRLYIVRQQEQNKKQTTSIGSASVSSNYIRLCCLPSSSWCHMLFILSLSDSSSKKCNIRVYLNGLSQSCYDCSASIIRSSSFSSTKSNWLLSIGQRSLDQYTSYYYDLGTLLLFDKELFNNEYIPSFLYSLGSDQWHFLDTQQTTTSTTGDYWVYRRFSLLHLNIPIDKFDQEQSYWRSILKRSLFASYTPSYPWTLFTFSFSDSNDGVNSTSVSNVPQSILSKVFSRSSTLPSPTSSTISSQPSTSSTSVSNPDLSSYAHTISLPSKIIVEYSTTLLNVCERIGGVLNFVYLYAKIIELTLYEQTDFYLLHVTDILFTCIWKMKTYYDLFHSLNGYNLIVKVLSSQQTCTKITAKFYKILLEHSLNKIKYSSSIMNGHIYDIHLFMKILLEWKIWKQSPHLYHKILETCELLLNDQHCPYYLSNRQLFKKHFALEHLLILCQEIIEDTNNSHQKISGLILTDHMASIIVNIIEYLLEFDLNYIAAIMNFVLLIHPLVKTYVTYNKEYFYFVQHYPKQKQQPHKTLIGSEVTMSRRNSAGDIQAASTNDTNIIDTNAVRHRCATIVVHSTSTNDISDVHQHPRKDSIIRPSIIEKDSKNLHNQSLTLNVSPVRKFRSFSDLFSSSLEVEQYQKRQHRSTIVTAPAFSQITSPNMPDKKRPSSHQIDCVTHSVGLLSTGLLKLLTTIVVTVPDRLMAKLIDNVFRTNVLIVLVLDSNVLKRIQCLKLLDAYLKRLQSNKIREDLIESDLIYMMANQLYQYEMNDDQTATDQQHLVETCLTIVFQRPIILNLSQNIVDQISDHDDFFSFLSTSSSKPSICPISQIGLALLLSLIEKLTLSESGIYICQIVLYLLNQIIERSNEFYRQYLIDIGLCEVLFNTLCSCIQQIKENKHDMFESYENIITSIQICFNTLVACLYATVNKTSVTFMNILHKLMKMIQEQFNTRQDIGHPNDWSIDRFDLIVLHQTLFSILSTIIDLTEMMCQLTKTHSSHHHFRTMSYHSTAPSTRRSSTASVEVNFLNSSFNQHSRSSLSDIQIKPFDFIKNSTNNLVPLRVLNNYHDESMFSSDNITSTTTALFDQFDLGDRFRKYLQLSVDCIEMIYSDHLAITDSLEQFTLKLFHLCLNGIAYNLEKKSSITTPHSLIDNNINSEKSTKKHCWSTLMLRCRDIIKQQCIKLLILTLDPERQRVKFRCEIIKYLLNQPNSKRILDYLFLNDLSLYERILIYFNQLCNWKQEEEVDDEQELEEDAYCRKRVKSLDSGHWTAFSSQISTGLWPPTLTKSNVVNEKFSTPSATKTDLSQIRSKKPNRKKRKINYDKEEDENDVESDSWSISSPTTDQDTEIPEKHSSLSLSSSISSEIVQQQSSVITTDSRTFIQYHQELFDLFRDAMRSVTIQTLTTQQTTFVNHLLNNQIKDIYLPSQTTKKITRLKSFALPSFDEQTPLLIPQRVSSATVSSSSIPVVTISSILNDKHLIYLRDFDNNLNIIHKRFNFNNQRFNKLQLDKTRLFTSKAMEITQDVINLQSHERKKFIEHIRLTQSLELRIKHLWHNLCGQLTHELSIWYEPQLYPQFWELDPTESPNRERRRLQRAYCLMDKKYFQSHIKEEKLMKPPLWYLFDSSIGSNTSSGHQSMAIQTILYRNEKIEYQCRCINVTPSNEIKGELLIGIQRIYFVADDQTTGNTKCSSIPYQTTYFYNYFSDDFNSFSFCFDQIREIYKRRYMLKDIALELFLTNGITLLLAQTNQQEREHLYKLLLKKNLVNYIHGETLTDVQLLWRQGLMTNFDYIMSLNKLAGRTFNDLMQYPICPYIVCSYDKDILDLHLTQNYRDLGKPIAIQHKEKEEKFIEMYKALKEAHDLSLLNSVDTLTTFSQRTFGPQSDPYHFASLYSNSGIVLHYLVRLLPYTRMFLDYQDQNFDCPDRTFHDIKTSWWLSSYESTSDFKELIPEFYFLHEFLFNKQEFNFGVKQNGQKVNDVNVPMWAKKDSRLFVNILRQALESDYVIQHLHHWIDLVFGFKQTAALDAINVFHAACYYGYPVDTVGDELTRIAHQSIIRTYGQVPKQLFHQQHPSSLTTSLTNYSNGTISAVPKRSERAIFEQTLPLDSIHRHVLGVKWGDFVGSYDQPSPEYVSKHECPIQVVQFICLNTGNEIICLPPSTSLFYQQSQEARTRSAPT
ncbi:unnamed protein product, partial [Didymodactylos carnosus]